MRYAARTRSSGLAALVILAASLVTPALSGAEFPPVPVSPSGQVDGLVRALRSRLEISAPVVVTIVPENALMMSVEAPADHEGPFQLAIDATFLAELTDEELEAAIAHELGHVWVFTHHPYLQTEQLANRIAMRVVTRGSLERVYEKVWKHGHPRRDPARMLGPEPKAAIPAGAGDQVALENPHAQQNVARSENSSAARQSGQRPAGATDVRTCRILAPCR